MGILLGIGLATTFACGFGYLFSRILIHKSFKAHQEIDYLHCNGDNYSCSDSQCVKMNFKDWKSLYLADPEHWRCIKGRSSDDELPVALPVYVNDDIIRPVKFLNERSYMKWQKYIVTQTNKGIDYQNAHNKMELLQSIAAANQKRIRDEQEKLDELQKQLSAGGI